MKTPTLIDPKATVAAAIKAGILSGPDRMIEIFQRAEEQWNQKQLAAIRTPEEAGIAKAPIPPRRPKKFYSHVAGKKRYVVTKADRPELFP